MNRYKKSYTVKVGTVMLSTLLLLGSCSEDAIIDDNGGKLGAASDNICFGISDNDGWPETRSAHTSADEVVTGNFVLRSADNADTLCVQTTVCDFGPLPFGNNAPTSRAALVTGDDMHDSFGVTACLTDDNSYLFFNEKNSKPDSYNPSAIWSYASGNIYYWPGEAHPLKFYAYSPYSCEGLTPPVKPDNGNTAPSFSYTVPADADNQTDLLAYATGEMSGATNTSVPLSFQHICTAVQFVVGKEMQSGTIESIKLKGVRNSGTYSFDTDWTLGETTAEFVHNVNKDVSVSTPDDTEKENITDDTDCFIMLPQTLPDGASVEIVFYDNTTGTDRTLTASIAGQVWPQGKRVKYNISISPDYKFELTDVPEAIDAHYVIFKTTLKVSGVADGKEWIVTASTTNDGTVTIICQDDMNDFAKDGFWTDRYIDASGNDEGSARGDMSFSGSGSGSFPIAIFIPENIGNASQEITLTIKFKGEERAASTISLTQLCPAWTDGNFGWEQTQDEIQGAYGFVWDRLISYQLVYSSDRTFYGSLIGSSGSRKKYCNKVISDNKNWESDEFAKTQEFHYKAAEYRYCITLDYSKLNDYVSTDSDDGLGNTKELYKNAGAATSLAFENTLRNIFKTERGHTTEKAFREMTAANLYTGSINTYGPKGEKVSGSDAIAQVLKKNRYNIKKEISKEGDYEYVSYSPEIKETDIVWFLPAVNQFSNMPQTTEYPFFQPVSKEQCWSSTAVEKSTDAKLGNGTTVSRKDVRLIRACRNRP